MTTFINKGWSSNKAKKVGITMSMVWTILLAPFGLWKFGIKFGWYSPINDGLFWQWFMGLVLLMMLVLVLGIALLIISEVLNWINDEE